MLEASVLGLALQAIAAVVAVPFDNVNVPPVMVPPKVIVCMALVLAVPAVVVATDTAAPVPVRLLTAVKVGRAPKFWYVSVTLVPLWLVATVTRSSLAVIVPELVPTETLVMVPAPAAPSEPALLVIDTPDSEPPATMPVLVFVPMVVLLMAPEPDVVSSVAVTVPELVPTETLVMVPAPAAPTEPELLVIDTPDSEPPVTVPVFVLMVALFT